MPKANDIEQRVILQNDSDLTIDYGGDLLESRTEWAISFLESLGY